MNCLSSSALKKKSLTGTRIFCIDAPSAPGPALAWIIPRSQSRPTETAGAVQNRNPWMCDNQALRQMTLVSRHGPRRRFLNRAAFSEVAVHTNRVLLPFRIPR
uniref:Uncharacterized protein LOC111121305 n=1 Tax=Crassostrea virginica TaxID=6565 RepID=A0A8B8CQY2_CRAVI|nr:uncharacterized protein LOC111121305 [Crassostrea virginica]XP_022318227.1 uncharacterized protein LOC111121305 [Crassostrea virginica]